MGPNIKRLLTRRVLLITGCVIFGVLIIWLVISIFSTNPNQRLSFNDLNAQVNVLESKKQYQKAVDLIKSQESASSESEQQLLATVYTNQGDFKDALKINKQLIAQYGSSLALDESTVTAALAAKDWKDAIYYLNQTATAAANDKSDPLSVQDSAYYKYQAQQIQKEHPGQ